MKPTPQELRAEVEDAGGPLYARYAPHWADVFDDPEPLRTKLAGRQGRLKPDAADAVARLLNAPGRTRRRRAVTRGELILLATPMILAIPALPEAKQKVWSLVLTALAGGNDSIDMTQPGIQQMFDLAQADGLLTADARAALVDGGPEGCSRAEELGWGAVNYRDVVAAKGV